MTSLTGWVVVMMYGMMCCLHDYTCMSFIAVSPPHFLMEDKCAHTGEGGLQQQELQADGNGCRSAA